MRDMIIRHIYTKATYYKADIRVWTSCHIFLDFKCLKSELLFGIRDFFYTYMYAVLVMQVFQTLERHNSCVRDGFFFA